MSEYQQDIRQILGKATGLSDVDVTMLEEATRIADLHHDVPLGMEARLALVRAGTWSGNCESAMAAFTWGLAQSDRQETIRLQWERRLLWHYRWIIETLSDYTQVTREQLKQSMADMANRYQRSGYSLGAVHDCQAYVHLRLGDLDATIEARRRWADSPQDQFSRCVACQTNSHVKFDVEEGKLEQAFETAQPIISGKQRCKSVPCVTFSRLLLAALRLGRTAIARDMRNRSSRQALSDRMYLDSAGYHLAYLALVGDCPRAIRVFETGIAWVMMQKIAWERMVFLECAEVMFDRLVENGDQHIQLRIPPEAPFHRQDSLYVPSQLRDRILQMHAELVAAFNARNGNTYMQQRYDNFRGLISAIPRMAVQ